MNKLLLIFFGIIGFQASTLIAAVPVRYVQISTNPVTTQAGGFNVSSGTLQTINVGSATVVNMNVTNATFTKIMGTIADTSTTTHSGIHNFSTATINSLNGSTITANTLLAGRGTINGDNAPTGFIGEYISTSVLQAVRKAANGTGNYTNICWMQLSTGDWDVSGLVEFTLDGATLTGGTVMAVSNSSGTSTTDHIAGNNTAPTRFPTASEDTSASVPAYRASLSSNTTYYLKFLYTYSAGAPTAWGRMSARRVR